MSARRSSALSRIPAPLLVFIGGGVGSLCRIYTPSYIYVANMLGAFALGVLTAWWSRRAARYGDEAVRPQRLLFGTGLLGGYTTYAALIAALNIFDEHNGTGDALMARLVGGSHARVCCRFGRQRCRTVGGEQDSQCTRRASADIGV